MDMSRRKMMGGIIAGVGAAAIGQAGADQARPAKFKQYKNEDFYKYGEFDVETALQAYYEMMEHYSYPIPPVLRTDEFWTADFGLGIFSEVGMAGIFWMNNLEHNYFGHEIYLLPGQMIPEHRHLATAAAGPKMEGWQVRHGSIYNYGEGTPTPGVDERISPSHRECSKARTELLMTPGETAMLGAPEQWHYMKAGPEGAIVTEYATYHDGDGLRFSHPDVKM